MKIHTSELKNLFLKGMSAGAQVLDQTNKDFDETKSQFASYQGTPQEADLKIDPSIIVIPQNAQDVCAAIQTASQHMCTVIPRSGGHQYCGLSSGIAIVQIDMRNFQDIRCQNNADNDSHYSSVYVGAGVRLKNLYSQLHNRGLLIPGGNCLQVAVGGHFQSSASGHFTKSFGLGLDLITEIDIVLANGQLAKLSKDENPNLFWAIRGGSPGAFGVVLGYRIDAIKVDQYENAYAARFIWKFDQHTNTCRKVLTNLIEIVKHPAIDQRRDATLSFTIGPNPFSSNHAHHDIIVTVMWTGIDSGSIHSNVPKSLNRCASNDLTFYNLIVKPFLDVTDELKDITEVSYPEHNLSFIANMMALPDPAGPTKKSSAQAWEKMRFEPKARSIILNMGWKSINKAVSGAFHSQNQKTQKNSSSSSSPSSPLPTPKATTKRYVNIAKFTGDLGFDTDDLVGSVLDRMDALYSSPAKLGTVFQFLPLDLTKTVDDGSTAVPDRTFKFGYDIWTLWSSSCRYDFDDKDEEEFFAAQKAAEWSEKTDKVLERVLGGPSNTGNLIFATNGDLDISKPHIRQRYYPNDDMFDRLCHVKAQYDPQNMFSTKFTVPPKPLVPDTRSTPLKQRNVSDIDHPRLPRIHQQHPASHAA